MEFEIEFSENPLVTDNPLGRLNIEYNFYKNSYITFYMPNVPGGRESHIEVLMKGGWGEDPVTRREKRNYGNYHLLMKLYKSILFSK